MQRPREKISGISDILLLASIDSVAQLKILAFKEIGGQNLLSKIFSLKFQTDSVRVNVTMKKKMRISLDLL